MAMQGDDLVMIGRGVSNGANVNPQDRPPLANGIHLRYAFDRDKGFPWHGYYLFRRRHRPGKPSCAYPPRLGALKSGIAAWRGPRGVFSATGQGLVPGEAFAPAQQSEFDLRNSPILQFVLPSGTLAREFQVTLGFYPGSAEPLPPKEPSGCLMAPLVAIRRLIGRLFGKPAPAPAVVRVTAYRGNDAMSRRDVTVVPGAIVTETLQADALDRVEVTTNGAGCALIEVCYIPVEAEVAGGWDTLRNFTYPMCLPAAQAGYPCAGHPATAAQALALAQSRVRYGPVTDWDAATFADMTTYLDAMLAGGPGAGPMAGRNAAVTSAAGAADDPHMPSLYPLEVLLLGSLHPAVAQVLGLYWVDQTAQPGVDYDYIVLADHDNSFGGLAANALRMLADDDVPASVDSWISFNLRVGPAPVLPAPGDPRCYALPGSAVASPQTPAPAGTNTAGLTWTVPVTTDGALLPDSPIGYHVWRSGPAAAAPSSVPPPGALITGDTPIVVADAVVPDGAQPGFASNWPPFRLHAYDRRLPDGWYSYRVAGVDIFGQFTALSAPAQWYQWQPTPDPRPWYYNGNAPGSDAVVNAWAVCLRDTTPPPAPPGVEAWVLDPEDPLLLQDDRVGDWLTNNPWWSQTASQATRIGVRVKWRWDAVQQLQAPDTAEFRLYFNPTSTLPATGARDPLNWQARMFVVPAANWAGVDPVTGDRFYDVLLPLMNNANFGGLPLAPSLTEPVVYGHVGVSAADDKTTADNARWQTPASWQVTGFGNRLGNEGKLGAPAKVYRVLRMPPPAPALCDTRDRVWASRADYHALSYYTFRWPKPADAGLLDAHIFRAMDDTLFAFDFAQRPRQPLDLGLLSAFPPGWDGPAIRQALLALDDPSLTDFAAALPVYQGLPDRALRVLASLPAEPGKAGNDGAFRQITTAPLDHTLAAQADRVGPDDVDPYTPAASLCAFRGELDGRARNRYFFRAAYVDGAHNPGLLGPSSPPVYLHKVEPPRTPVITRVAGGDRGITITFASNREDDLAEYRLYRADTARQASDVRLMSLVATLPETVADPGARPVEMSWTDEDLPAGVTLYYGVVAVDVAGNRSPLSALGSGRAYDTSRPASPTWNAPQPGPQPHDAILSWSAADPNLACRVERSLAGVGDWSSPGGWLPRGVYTFTDDSRRPQTVYDYRLRVLDGQGRQNDAYLVLTL